MEKYKCLSCPIREKFEKNPKSFLGKLWRWHINFCPGWKAYFQSLPQATQEVLREEYNFTKY